MKHTITTIRDFCACIALVALALAAFAAAQLFHKTGDTVAALPGQITETRDALVSEVGIARMDLDAQLTEAQGRAERQIAAARKDAIGEVQSLHADALKAFGYALVEADTIRSDADDQLTTTNAILLGTARATADTMGHASDFLDAYAALPDRVATSPAWLSIEPEVTCEKDGAGYGGCWHSRVTALLGEAANAGGVFTRKFPALADAAVGTSQSIDHMTQSIDRLYFGHKSFWQEFKGTLGIVTGAARTAGAFGAFDVQPGYVNPFAGGIGSNLKARREGEK